MLMTELGLMDAFMPVVGTKAASMMDRASMMLVEKRAPEMTVLRLLQNLPPRHLTDVRRRWKVCPQLSSREVEGGSELVEYPGDRRFLISKKGCEERNRGNVISHTMVEGAHGGRLPNCYCTRYPYVGTEASRQ